MKKRLMWIFLGYGLIVLLFIWLTPKKIVWIDYFQKDRKNPYGTHIIYNHIEEIFTDVETRESSLYNLFDEKEFGENENMIFITSFFSLSEDELDNLVQYVEEGNNVLISANNIMHDLLDTLNIETDYQYYSINDFMPGGKLQVNLIDNIDSTYSFEKQSNLTTLETKFDSLQAPTILSYAIEEDDMASDSIDRGIFVAQKFGEGTFYLHTLPYAFTNYYMLNENNHQYASGVLSYLPNTKTIWDEYYKPVSYRSQPMLKVFLSAPALKWATILGGSLLLCYIVFQIKRKQRIIPIINPPENRSLEFTNTIGDLYFSTQDNNDLLDKMESHFKEYIKEKFYIYNYSGSENETEKLVAKSGRTLGLVSTINTLFKTLRQGTEDHSKIILLSQKLHHFYYGRK